MKTNYVQKIVLKDCLFRVQNLILNEPKGKNIISLKDQNKIEFSDLLKINPF